MPVPTRVARPRPSTQRHQITEQLLAAAGRRSICPRLRTPTVPMLSFRADTAGVVANRNDSVLTWVRFRREGAAMTRTGNPVAVR